MNNLKKILTVALTIGLMVACDDQIVDLTERDRLPAALAVADLTGIESSLNQVKERARSIHENNDISLYKQCGTDIVTSGTHLGDVADGGMEGMMTYSGSLSSLSPEIENLYNGLISSITSCNIVIQFASNYSPATSDEEDRLAKSVGEAYALRAYLYLEMAQRWENNVIFTKILEEGDEIVFDVTLSPPSDVYAQIISDCTNALDYLPTRAEKALTVGDASKGMAYHILSKAYMAIGDYGKAVTAAESVITDGSYELQPLDNIFSLEGGKEGNESNDEIIFSWVFSPDIDSRPQRTVQMFVPLYRLVDGLTTALDQGGRPWSRLSPSEYYWSLFEDGDGRVDAWHKTEWTYNDDANLPAGKALGDVVTQDDVIAQFGADAGRPLRYIDPTTSKFFEDDTYGRETNDAEGFSNIIVFRLSEAYIIAAEAHWRNGNTGRAMELLNTIRERAFGDTSHNFATIDLETIIEEHARELGHEGHRWAFLKRLGLLAERTSLYCKGLDGEDITVQAHQVRWPIPQPFVDLTGVPQNPGY